MALATVNLVAVDCDATLDEWGFRHAATAIGERLGAARIGAGVYDAFADAPIWPYHYHHGIEEWVYVLKGAPVLRDPLAERTLAPGHLVCFPSGALGAHAISGPGRFAIFATGQFEEPWLSVYPDSGKVSGPEGVLLAASAVGYWYGEGTAGPEHAAPEPARSAPAAPASPPVFNALAWPSAEHLELGSRLGATRLSATLIDLEPGAPPQPYHCVYGQEAWLVVLRGTPTLRHPGGEQRLAAADVVCLPDGASGARALSNPDPAAARVLQLATTGRPVNLHYPDTGRWRLRHGPGDELEIGPG